MNMNNIVQAQVPIDAKISPVPVQRRIQAVVASATMPIIRNDIKLAVVSQ